MGISYLPLWYNLSQKGISKTELATLIGISSATLAKLSKNEYVNLSIIDKICEKFDYPIEEVIKYVARKSDFVSDLETNCFYEAELPLGNKNTTLMPVILLKEIKRLEEASLYLVAPFVEGRDPILVADLPISHKQISFFEHGGCVCFSKMEMIPYESIKKRIGVLPYNLISTFKNKYDELYSI